MRLGAHFPNGAVQTIGKERIFNRKNAILVVFCQIFLIVSIIMAGNQSANAHHAPIYREYFQKFPGLNDQKIRYPFRNASPKSNFKRSDIRSMRMLVCNRHTVPGTIRDRVLHFPKRKVRIDIDPKLALTESSVNGLGKLGLHYTWRNCPAKPTFHLPSYGRVEVEIWRSNEIIYRFASAKNSPLHDSVDISRLWSKWDAQRERERQQQIQKQKQAQAVAARARREKEAAESAAFWSKFWFFAFIIGGGWIWFKYRGPIMAFYYENFTKHPAETLVNKSVRTGVKLDGQSLARELDKAAQASNPIEAKVRAKQAREIAKKATEQADVYKAQEELADAMMDVERAKRAEKRAREAVRRAEKKKD